MGQPGSVSRPWRGATDGTDLADVAPRFSLYAARATLPTQPRPATNARSSRSSKPDHVSAFLLAARQKIFPFLSRASRRNEKARPAICAASAWARGTKARKSLPASTGRLHPIRSTFCPHEFESNYIPYSSPSRVHLMSLGGSGAFRFWEYGIWTFLVEDLVGFSGFFLWMESLC